MDCTNRFRRALLDQRGLKDSHVSNHQPTGKSLDIIGRVLGRLAVLLTMNRDRSREACNWPPSARQDIKERESSDDGLCRSDESYSPRRHWRPVQSPTVKRGCGVTYRRMMTFVGFGEISIWSLLCVRARGSDRRDRRSKWPRRAREDVTHCRYCTLMLPALI